MALVIGLVVALALIGGGVAAWLLLRDNGESTRAQYCAAIKKLAPGGDLTSAVSGGAAAVTAQLTNLADLAPNSVADDWKTLESFIGSAEKSQSNVNMTTVLSAFGALKNIISDSNDHCGTTFKSPLSR